MSLFKKLSPEEATEYKQWAHENYTIGQPINGNWHPVVRNECMAMNQQFKDQMDAEDELEKDDFNNIRSELNTLDTMAGVISEFLEGVEEPLEDTPFELLTLLLDVQTKVTEIQEQQGWI